MTEKKIIKPQRGRDIIAAFVKTLPNRPGVYRMIGAEEQVLYVGKAKNLKKRVENYARTGAHNNRIERMVALTTHMEFIETETELEALLLEANLIKQLKPRFNVLLRDDKSFPYILVAREHEAAEIGKHRGARTRKGDYFGPFASAGAVNRTLTALQKAFLLRSCSDSYYESRSRPCLLYQIKRCSAPCTGEISIPEYEKLVEEAVSFLKGRSQAVRSGLQEEMMAASERLDFETAARLRDRLSALSVIQSTQGINPGSVVEADVFALDRQAGKACVQVFFFRLGQNWGNRAYYPRTDAETPDEEVLGSFLVQFYEDKPVPSLILLSHELGEMPLISDALSQKSGARVEVAAPKRGEKRQLIEHAMRNAKQALARQLSESAGQSELLERLAETLGLEDVPERIEVYDNSHIMGTNAVGGMIVAGPEGMMKAQYRKYNMKGEALQPGDDYGMMREMLTRRFKRLTSPKMDDEEGQKNRPDLVMIDGGKGQLSAARDVMKELGVDDIPLIAIAKGEDRDAGRETFFMPGREPFKLPPRDPVLYFIQRLRDEAHRFAIGAHRTRRSGDIRKNPLDEIEGIGPSRKKALLHHFGSAKGVSRASLQDLKSVPGVSSALAETIHAFFNEPQG